MNESCVLFKLIWPGIPPDLREYSIAVNVFLPTVAKLCSMFVYCWVACPSSYCIIGVFDQPSLLLPLKKLALEFLLTKRFPQNASLTPSKSIENLITMKHRSENKMISNQQGLAIRCTSTKYSRYTFVNECSDPPLNWFSVSLLAICTKKNSSSFSHYKKTW